MINEQKWLQHYYDLEEELRRAMKPDPMIAYRLGNVPTFLPKIDVGKLKSIVPSINKLTSIVPSIDTILNFNKSSSENEDKLDIVSTFYNNQENSNADIILDKGKT